jgi:hypothetical protein
MAFYLPFSKFVDSAEAVVAPGAVILAEGQALVRVNTAPANGVMPSSGQASDIFVGFAIAGTSAAPFPEAYTNKVEEFTVPGSGIVTLQLTPVAGQVFIFDKTTGAPATGTTVTGKNISGLTAGDDVVVTYKYAVSVVQLRALQGDVQPGGYVGAYVGQIGVIKRGIVFTSEFDASKNWAAATSIKLAANGQVTDQSGSGVAIVGYVVAAPSQDQPFLGIEFSAP